VVNCPRCFKASETAFRLFWQSRIHHERDGTLAVFRIAAAAVVLLVIAPEKSRQAISAIFSGAEDARRAIPSKEEVAATALAYCRRNPETCASAAQKAMDAEKRLKP
jgi:Sec-independent protein translocase protein TatA